MLGCKILTLSGGRMLTWTNIYNMQTREFIEIIDCLGGSQSFFLKSYLKKIRLTDSTSRCILRSWDTALFAQIASRSNPSQQEYLPIRQFLRQRHPILIQFDSTRTPVWTTKLWSNSPLNWPKVHLEHYLTPRLTYLFILYSLSSLVFIYINWIFCSKKSALKIEQDW